MQPKFIMTAGLIVLALGASLGAWAAIYKTVDEHGNTVFTDVPPKETSNSVKVETHNSYTPPAPATQTQPATRSSAWDTQQEDESTTPAGYSAVSITHPTDDLAVRENAGNLTVSVATSPQLYSNFGHQIRVLMDGQVVGSSAAGSVSLTNIDRGTHTLVANVVDGAGNVLASSEPVTFHMLRYSRLGG